MKRKTIPTPLYKKVWGTFQGGIVLSTIFGALLSLCVAVVALTNNWHLGLLAVFLLSLQYFFLSLLVWVAIGTVITVLVILWKLIQRDFPDPLEPISSDKIVKELLPLLKDTGRENVGMQLKVVGNDQSIDILGSKVGGIPYIPENMIWPVNDQGEKLHFFAQINFANVPSNKELPKKGLLQLFILDNDWRHGLDDSMGNNVGGKNVRLVFYPNPDKNKQKEISLPSVSKESVIRQAAEISFEQPFIQYRPLHDYLTPDKKIVDTVMREVDDIDEILEEKGFRVGSYSSCLLGYPVFAQDDPRAYKALKEKLGVEEEWVQLFQFASDQVDDKKWGAANFILQWGDAGYGHIFIRKTDLLQGKFDNVLYWWDCY